MTTGSAERMHDAYRNFNAPINEATSGTTFILVEVQHIPHPVDIVNRLTVSCSSRTASPMRH